MTRDGRRLLKNRGRASDEGAGPGVRGAGGSGEGPSMHLASTDLASLHLAIKSYLVAGEHYRLSPHVSNPRYFSPLVRLECSKTGYGGAKWNPSIGAQPLPR